MTTDILAGASGYAFKEWKGDFYPAKIRPDEMLGYYAARLPTVEINNSFYQMPRAEVLQTWLGRVPPPFRFTIKSPRRITHEGRLDPGRCADDLAHLYQVLDTLGAQRGAVLFQLPPFQKLDLAKLRAFLALLPADHRAAFEFRHDSWFTDATYAALAEAGAVLCISEREDAAPPPLVRTADWGYVRLRLEHYDAQALQQWAQRIVTAGWDHAYAYFMHEPTAPAYARALIEAAGH